MGALEELAKILLTLRKKKRKNPPAPNTTTKNMSLVVFLSQRR